MELNLTYGASFLVIRSLLHLPESKSEALRGRMQHLQKYGFPEGLNTGRGKAATYRPPQLALLSLAFQMIELGLGPEKTANLLRSEIDTVRDAFACALKSEGHEAIFVCADPAAFSDTRSSLVRRSASALGAELASSRCPHRKIIVNVSYLVTAISAHLDLLQLSLALGIGVGARFKKGLLTWALSDEDSSDVDP